MVVAKKPKELNIVLEPSIQFRGTVLGDDRKPTSDLPPHRITWPYLEAEPPEGRRASHTENFYVTDISSNNPNRFDIDAAPSGKTYCFVIQNSGFVKEDNTQVLGRTDSFSLPPVGVYGVTFRWTVTEKGGLKVRRVVIESVKDAAGNSVALNVTKKRETPEYLFLRWTLCGTIHDDLGNPLEGVKVQLYRGDDISRYAEKSVTTTADGKYSFEITASQRSEPSPNGEFVSVKATKDGFFERNMNQKNLVFLSDEKNPSEKNFVLRNNETSRFVNPQESTTFDFVLNRNPSVEGVLLNDDDEPLVGYRLWLGSDTRLNVFDQDMVTDIRQINTDKRGKFRIEKFPADIKYWFDMSEQQQKKRDVLRTDDLVFSPGMAYRVGLRLRKDEDGIRQLVLETVTDTDGKDLSSQIVTKDPRAQSKKLNRAAPEQENRVREALRKMETAGEYWLKWYPKDLPEFSYTFHQKDAEPRLLTWKEIKEADNWYAEFYRKGISYIGVSRLLLIDIDGLRCGTVSEDVEKGLLTFEFQLSNEWMNAVGNGISDTWKGWFNGGIDMGTAIIDTKTSTLVEVKTENYDERYSDYFELKPGKFVPRRIVIDYHKGNREGEATMFFDFRFKIYKPCLWLFDHNVVEDKDPNVRISDVLVDGKPAVAFETK
jgi:5-hydroxyisourate hydrolase-like protein (transthyretin family)